MGQGGRSPRHRGHHGHGRDGAVEPQAVLDHDADEPRGLWHSSKQYDPQVYHNETRCNTGNNIERENVRQGTGNRPLCKERAQYP